MKAAVMTWHTYDNFGSLLQAYALQRSLEKLGVESYLVNYDPESYNPNNCTRTSDWVKTHIRMTLKKALSGAKGPLSRKVYPQWEDEERKEAYKHFRSEFLRFTKECVTASDLFSLNDEFDMIACGSDQIWAPTRFNPHYYLDFAKDPERTLAYAPSIGLPSIDDEVVRTKVRELAGRIRHLSVREERGAEILESILGTRPAVAIDPTALLTGDEWCEAMGLQGQVVEERYALCYFLGNDRRKWESASRIAGSHGLVLRGIPVFKQDGARDAKLCLGVGPKEFLELIYCSEAVFTDSFHGTMFSLLFHKEPFVYKRFSDKDRKNQNSRIENILRIANLGATVLQSTDDVSARSFGAIDWDAVDRGISEAREASEAFLSHSVSEINRHVASSSLPCFPPTMTCCGCGACVSVCPTGALSLTESADGFLEAHIDREKCIECGACARVCPFANDKGKSLRNGSTYSYISADDSALSKSSSGALAHDLTADYLEHGESVTGCALRDRGTRAVHITLPSAEGDASAFQGSKYIQSDFRRAFDTLMLDGRHLVIGTPCEIAAMRNVIEARGVSDRYVLVDLICHGVPSAHLYRKQLSEFRGKRHDADSPIEVRFRNKLDGSWRDWTLYLECEGDELRIPEARSAFYALFNKGNCYMPSCYECLWRTASAADIRIGDYWGSRFSGNDKCVSMAVAMTEKGKSLLKRVAGEHAAHFMEQDVEDYFANQQIVNRDQPLLHDRIIAELKDPAVSLEGIAKRYCGERSIQALARKIRGIVSRGSHE